MPGGVVELQAIALVLSRNVTIIVARNEKNCFMNIPHFVNVEKEKLAYI